MAIFLAAMADFHKTLAHFPAKLAIFPVYYKNKSQSAIKELAIKQNYF